MSPEQIAAAAGRPVAQVRAALDRLAGVEWDEQGRVAGLGLTSLRSTLCEHVHFFRFAAAASRWQARHPEGWLLPVADAFRLGRRLVDDLLRPATAA